MMKETLLSSEAARILNVSAQTLRSWADCGKLAATRTVGGVRLFRREDVDRFLAAKLKGEK